MLRTEALGDERLDGHADELVALVAEDFLRLGVDQRDPAAGRDHDHGVGRRLEDLPERVVGHRAHPPRTVAEGGDAPRLGCASLGDYWQKYQVRERKTDRQIAQSAARDSYRIGRARRRVDDRMDTGDRTDTVSA